MLKKLGLVLLITALAAGSAAGARPAAAATTPAPAKAAPKDVLNITALAAVLMDAGSGQVLYSKEPDLHWPPASITKVMTMLLVVEALEQGKIKLEDQVPVSDEAYRMGGSQIWLDPGERLTVKDLLYAIALQSANDACIALAEHLAGSETAFVQLMNERAKELGAKNTNFTNAHGLHDPDFYVSAMDMALFAREAVKHPKLLEFTSTFQEYLRGGKTWLVNTNRLLRFYQGADGLKTGSHSQAKSNLVATAKRDGLRLIAVVLGAETSQIRFNESSALLNYGFANYKGVALANRTEVVKKVRVYAGDIDFVDAVPATETVVAVKKGEAGGLTRRVMVPDLVPAPVKKGAKVGELQVVDKAGNVVGRVDLVAVQEAKALPYPKLVLKLFLRAIGLPGAK